VRLGEEVREALASRHVEFDDKPLQAHVTLARVRDGADRAELGATLTAALRTNVTPLAATASEIVVMESVIGAQGPRYTRRAAVALVEVGGKR
jgi:2'-5' RNA ligase